ncbi:MAG TPA: PD-(D/E)XK nuclease family protein, partial [Ktedonobacterales bacterium]
MREIEDATVVGQVAAMEMTVPPVPPVRAKDGQPRAISPTDVSRFITLDQCERFLRLSLYAGNAKAGRHFLQDEFGVQGQGIPPLLTRSGLDFERAVEAAVRGRHAVTNFAAEAHAHVARGPNNARMVAEARSLAPGESRVYFQVRLHVVVAGWQIRGDADLVRLARDDGGVLRVLVADMKSSAKTKVEHRLQVAFYAEMLAALFAEAGVDCAEIGTAILYRGPLATEELTAEELARHARERALALEALGTDVGLLELTPDPENYRASVRDLVTGPTALARRVAEADFASLPYCLDAKCDGCVFNEFCLTQSARADDLSLLPHLGASEKHALRRAGVTTMRQLALVKEPVAESVGADVRLVPTAGHEELARRLAATWPVGPRL